VFLGYSSCHLGYRCLDLSSNSIYIFHHVRFHEQSFPFLKTEHVSVIPDSNLQPTFLSHLPILTHFLSTETPSTLSKQVPLPPVVAMSTSHFASPGSTALDNTATGSVVPFVAPSIAPSGEQSSSPSGPSSSSQCPALSPPALDLCVDLSRCSLPQQPTPVTYVAQEVSCQHHMVLRPRQHRFANLSSIFASPLQPHSRVTCFVSDHEPLNFKYAYRFLCWQYAMRSKITALHVNSIWSLVSFEPSMNVVGCCWI
jgi:hypothetical protein